MKSHLYFSRFNSHIALGALEIFETALKSQPVRAEEILKKRYLKFFIASWAFIDSMFRMP